MVSINSWEPNGSYDMKGYWGMNNSFSGGKDNDNLRMSRHHHDSYALVLQLFIKKPVQQPINESAFHIENQQSFFVEEKFASDKAHFKTILSSSLVCRKLVFRSCDSFTAQAISSLDTQSFINSIVNFGRAFQLYRSIALKKLFSEFLYCPQLAKNFYFGSCNSNTSSRFEVWIC